MPVVVIADVPGIGAAVDREVAERMDFPSHPGFRLRLSGPTDAGRRIMTLWDSLEDFEAFRDGALAEALHDGDLPVPKMEIWEVETVIGPQ